VERDPSKLFAPPAVIVERHADGSMRLRSPQPLKSGARCVGDWLIEWASHAPDRLFLAERGPDGRWRGPTYAEAYEAVVRIGSWLLGLGPSGRRPLLMLPDNSVDASLLTLAAMHVGIPAVPVSPAYSLMSNDFGKLKAIVRTRNPGVMYVADAPRFAAALAAIEDLHTAVVIAASGHEQVRGVRPWAELLATRDESAVARAFAAIGADTVAKLLFTSGSTGTPKGVVNTQRMLCANQQQLLQIWPFSAYSPPVVVDWLPWSHTFGGNHNFNFVLRAGGTLYIDAGRPVAGLIERTVANLKEIAPTIYFNVPRGYDLLVGALRADADLRQRFFSRLQLMFYAAAALPEHLWEALEQLALEATGGPIVLVSSWGSTETAPLATACHFRAARAGNIGLPVPGCELKLVPGADKLEVRVRGPQVMPGYWNEPMLSAQAFDEEGFYRIGDRVRFVDERHPQGGLYFDGRIAEDFKLTTGTWVNVGGLRVKALAALAPLVQDLVVAGHGRDHVAFLMFPHLANCRRLCGESAAAATAAQILASEAVTGPVRAGLERLRREGVGSSTHASRALFLEEPPSLDAGEITDKGYINQRAVLERRAAAVEALYGDPPPPEVLELRNDPDSSNR